MGIMEIGDDIINLFRKAINVFGLAWIGKCCRCSRVTPWRATNAEINSSRIQRVEHAKDFGNFERAVMRQHHSATADTDRLGACSDLPDHDFGTRSSKTRKAVMFSNPEPLIAKFLRCFS